MGLGCWKLTKKEFEEIEKREIGMKMLSLANLRIDDIAEKEEEEEEEEVMNWNEWEWEEEDFDFVENYEELSIQSRPRLALPPPPAHPRPFTTLTSINENYDELSNSSSRPQVTKITLSTTGPWNNPSPSLSPPRSSSPPPLIESSTSLVPLSFDNNNEEEDFPVLPKSFLYKSAYEPFIPPPPSSSSLKKPRIDHQDVVEIKLDENERVLDNLTDESENELFDGDDDEIQDADEDEWLKNKTWGEYSKPDW